MRNITTITIGRKTREELAKIGSKDDSFDAIVKRLIEEWNQKK